MIRALLLLLLVSSVGLAAEPDKKIDFEQDIRPLFVKYCYACHAAEKQKGGLRLDRREQAVQGGDSGPAFVPKMPEKSLMLKLIQGDDPDRVMPPKGDRLTKNQLLTLQLWIKQGAIWPIQSSGEDNQEWWSLKPLKKPALPDISGVANPIDRYVRVKLGEKGLTSSPEADRQTLIRRVYFDLIGLPPTFEEMEAFVKNPDPDAYVKLVDQLLASPRYGERWARHWLDVVHYGDTHGYDKDKPRSNAWPYRDYVIRSFNQDKSYTRFVQEQLAGDVLYPLTLDGITALGFLAAGPWDFIGHAEVPESKLDGKVARHLDRDDMIATTMNTFISMTVQCAQCHNHKFDPIRQEEYYQVQAVFAAIDRADKPYYADEASAKQVRQLTEKRRQIRADFHAVPTARSLSIAEKSSLLDHWIASATKPASMKPEYGYHSQIASKPDMEKWIQIDLGAKRDLSQIVLWPCHDDFNNIGDGFGFPKRYRIEVSDDDSFKHAVLIADVIPNSPDGPGVKPQIFDLKSRQGRYVRITAKTLASRQNDYIFALAEVQVFDSQHRNISTSAKLSALDSIEAPVRWRLTNLTDGYAPGMASRGPAEQAAIQKGAFRQYYSEQEAPRIESLLQSLIGLEESLKAIPKTGLVYAGTVYTGAGAFRGTGPEGKPREIRILKRGDVSTPGEVVAPGAPELFKNFSGKLPLSPGHSEGERRAALARWITDHRNPLTWRSIVNRVWHYHFGRGIVASPNDFGHMGQLPTHPDLLDYLAADFRDGNQSIKELQKLIVTSSTYKQASVSHVSNSKLDEGNVYLWRGNRRKLDAESVRDAALSVSGVLNTKMYGPAFQDFVVQHPEHSPHYEYQLSDPEDRSTYRRSVYRFLVRSKPQPFMTVLDCADPSLQVDQRIETLSPLQALSLYNNAFMLTMSKHLAKRSLVKDDLKLSLANAFRFALSRSATREELELFEPYAKKHGLESACRVILNMNEFIFVD